MQTPSHEIGAEGHICAPKISITIHFLYVNPKDTFFKILSPSRIGLMQLDCILGINPGGCWVAVKFEYNPGIYYYNYCCCCCCWGGALCKMYRCTKSKKKKKKKKDAKDHAQGCISRAKPEIGIRTVSPPGLALQGSAMGRCWGGWGFV